MKKKMNTKDHIFAGAFGAIYIVILFASVAILAINPLMYLFTPLIVGIIQGPVFALYTSKVPKKGAILLLSTLCGLLITAYSPIPFIVAVVSGVVAEIFMKNRDKDLKGSFTLAYCSFNLLTMAPFTLLIFAREQFLKVSLGYYGQAYVDKITSLTPSWILIVLVVLALIGGFFGARLGQKLNKKHFERAGLV